VDNEPGPRVRLRPRLAPVAKSALILTLLACPVAGCSGDAAHTPDPAVICDGDPALRFVFRNAGGGQLLPGSQVMYENGSPYLFVDGQCAFWVGKDLLQDVRGGTLTTAQADALSQALRLSDWNRYKGEYYDDLCDGPVRRYRFGADEVAVYPTCTGPKTSQPVDWMLDAALSQVSAIYDAATPATGPVRYVLVAEPADVSWPPAVTALAADWPLAGDPAAMALTFEQAGAYQPGMSLSAQPPDADALRGLRRAFAAAGGGAYSGGFVPVLGQNDGRYELFVRDSIPLEDAQGLLHLD
jgi:hypothetical protein